MPGNGGGVGGAAAPVNFSKGLPLTCADAGEGGITLDFSVDFVSIWSVWESVSITTSLACSVTVSTLTSSSVAGSGISSTTLTVGRPVLEGYRRRMAANGERKGVDLRGSGTPN